MSFPTFEQDGFFEGVYDHDFQSNRDITPEQLKRHLPYMGRWDLQHAQPVVIEFSEGVEDHLGKLNLPWRQTNQLVQVGLQYHRSLENRKPVPDAYMVHYSRLGRFASGDIERSLVVAVLREEVAEELANADLSWANDTDRSWLKIAQQAQRFGNAVLAFSINRNSYKNMIGGSGKRKGSLTKPADEKLAQAAFETIAFWEQ